RHAGMRYRGQSYEVVVPVPRLRGPQDMADLITRFHDAHQRRYSHMAQAEAVEIVNFQVTAVALIAKPAWKTFERTDAPAKPHEARQAYFSAGDTPARCRYFGAAPCSRACGSKAQRSSRRKPRPPCSIRGSARTWTNI